MDTRQIKSKQDWIKVWSGRWSLISDSYLADFWTGPNKVGGRVAYPIVVYVYQNGISDCWVSKRDKDDLGQRLISNMKSDSGYLKEISSDLQQQADRFFAFTQSNSPANLSLENYKEFWGIISDYYLPHLSVKYIVDYMSEAELKESFSILEEARLYAEPVFRDMENFVEAFVKSLAENIPTDPEALLFSTGKEVLSYLEQGVWSPQPTENRKAGVGLIAEDDVRQIVVGSELILLESLLEATESSNLIGQTAFKGAATGEVKIILDPVKDASKFNDGDILVAGMTRPEFLPLMKKATAFITDAGGMLSHAAITARELKKPCIVGTKNATKILKDGDLVEVDTSKGIVKVLKHGKHQ
jgi:phosphohistidine swiveling domain-containing protein